MSGFLHCWVPLGYWCRFLVIFRKFFILSWNLIATFRFELTQPTPIRQIFVKARIREIYTIFFPRLVKCHESLFPSNQITSFSKVLISHFFSDFSQFIFTAYFFAQKWNKRLINDFILLLLIVFFFYFRLRFLA